MSKLQAQAQKKLCFCKMINFLSSHVIEKELKCQSPQQLILLLRKHLASDGPDLSRGPIRILDIAAGNGRVGVELRALLGKKPGISRLVGTDLMELVKLAAIRDRKPYPYDEYIVADLIACSHLAVQQWMRECFDVVTICAALGPGDGDLPLEVVDAVVNLLPVNGLLAFTVNHRIQCRQGERYENFLGSLENSGNKTHWDELRLVDRKVYQHRLNFKGKAIEYTALVCQKRG